MLKQVGLIASGEFYKTEVRERAKESVENFESVLKGVHQRCESASERSGRGD